MDLPIFGFERHLIKRVLLLLFYYVLFLCANVMCGISDTRLLAEIMIIYTSMCNRLKGFTCIRRIMRASCARVLRNGLAKSTLSRCA